MIYYTPERATQAVKTLAVLELNLSNLLALDDQTFVVRDAIASAEKAIKQFEGNFYPLLDRAKDPGFMAGLTKYDPSCKVEG